MKDAWNRLLFFDNFLGESCAWRFINRKLEGFGLDTERRIFDIVFVGRLFVVILLHQKAQEVLPVFVLDEGHTFLLFKSWNDGPNTLIRIN
jgi:hypothetical protein